MPYIFKNITVDDESVELEASYLGLTLEEFVKKFGLKEIQNTTDPVGKKKDPSEKDASAGQEVEVMASNSENGLSELSEANEVYVFDEKTKVSRPDIIKSLRNLDVKLTGRISSEIYDFEDGKAFKVKDNISDQFLLDSYLGSFKKKPIKTYKGQELDEIVIKYDKQFEKAKKIQSKLDFLKPTEQDYAFINDEADNIFVAETELPKRFRRLDKFDPGYYETIYPKDYKKYLEKTNNNLEEAKKLYIKDKRKLSHADKLEKWARENESLLAGTSVEGFLKEQEKAAKIIGDRKAKELTAKNATAVELSNEIKANNSKILELAESTFYDEESYLQAKSELDDLIQINENIAEKAKNLYDESILIAEEANDNNLLLDVAKRSYSVPKIGVSNVGATVSEMVSGLLDIPEWLYVSIGSTISKEDPLSLKAQYRIFQSALPSGNVYAVSESAKDFSKDLRESVAKPIDVTDIKSLSDFGYWATDLTTNQLPNVALMVAAPQVALPIISASAAGNKYSSMMESMEKYGEEYNGWQLMSAPLIVGTAEYLTEKISLGQLKNIKSIFKKSPDALKAANDYIENNILKGKYWKTTFGEAGGEGIATLSENITDIYLLNDKTKHIWDGVPNAIASGGFMSGVIFKAPAVGAKILRPFSGPETQQRLQENFKQFQKISKELNENNKLSQSAKNSLIEAQSKITNDSNDLLQQTFDKIDGLSDADKTRLIKIDKQAAKIEVKAKEIFNDNSLSEDIKESLINDLNNEYKAIKSEKNIITKIGVRETMLEKAIEKGVVENIYSKSFDTAAELKQYVISSGRSMENAIGASSNYGAIFQNEDGSQEILINKELAKKHKRVSTADHEFLHAILYNTVKNNPQAAVNLGKALFNELKSLDSKNLLKNTDFKQRLKNEIDLFNEGKKDEATAWEEALTLFSEALVNKEFDESIFDNTIEGKSFIQKIKEFIQRLFNKEIGTDIEFNTGKDVINFIREYNKSFQTGKWGENIKKISKEGAKGRLIQEDVVVSVKPTIKTSTALSDLRQQRDELDIFDFDDPNEFDSALANIERKIKIAEKKEKEAKAKPAVEKPRKKADEKQLGDQFKEMVPPGTSNSEYRKNIAPKVIRAIEDDRMLFPLVRKIASGYGIVADNVYGRSFDDFYNAAISVQFKNNILNFKPESNDDLGGYIIGGQAGIRNRVKEALEKFKKEQSKTVEDIGQARDITADEATGPKQETRKKYKSLINSNTIPNFTVEEIKTKLLDKIGSLKSKITDAAGDNAAMTPLIKEIKSKIAKVAGDKEAIPKLVRKRMGGTYKRGMESGVYKNFLLKNKKAIIQNMPTTWLMGKDKKTSVSGGFPLAIEKSVGGEYTGEFETVNIAGVEAKYEIFKPNYVPYPKWVGEKIDREGGAKRGITSGNQLVRRISESKIDNMSDEAFLDNFIIEGDNKKGQDIFESLSLALGEELSFEIISKELKNPNSEISKVFENNQQALGVVIKDNIAQEFSRQAERGLVKFSMSNEDAKLLIDTVVKEGIYSEKAKNIASRIGFSDNKYEEFIDGKLHEGIVAYMQDLAASNRGFKYEKALNNILNKFTGKNINVSVRKNIEGDLNIQIENNVYIVEVKLNNKAQVGSASIGFFEVDKSGNIKLKNKSDLSISRDLSVESLELFNNFLDDKKTIKYLKDLVNAVNAANKKSKNLKATINKNGHIKLPYKDFWENIKNEMPKKIAGSASYIGNESIIEDFYKNVDLIQIGDYGAYSIGDNSKFKAYYNRIKAETINTLRPVRSKNTVYIRLFPSFKTIKSEKTDSLDTSKGIKKLADISLEVSNYDDVQKGQGAINNATKYSYAKNPKGISVWDFDDTLARTKSNVLYTMPDGTKGKLDAAEFAARSESLADMGAEFDFSEFSKVMKGEKGPMFDKAIARNKKFGNENVYILTARPADSKFAIHEFLKGIGLDIKLDNIVGLADGNPQAKANWMIGKVAEGYNDFYFADDHIGNVKAVREVLDTFDVKGKVQQARVKFSKSLNTRFNEILERKTGVNAFKEYSNIVAKRAGRKKGRFKIWMPSSLDDFKGLTSYTFAGKGKQGEEDQKFFQDALITPYFRGIQAINTKKQRLKEDFRKLNKMYRPIMKKLGKLIPSGDYTHDQAIRVYLWNKSGYEIPGIPKKDLKRLVKFVEGDSDILTYANMLQRIAKRKNWVKPSAYWDAETILSDLNNITEKVGRKEYLQEFIENADIVFSEKNLNKIEATFGTSHRDALEDILYRMKNGTNRRFGSNKLENKFNNWVNNSIGAIMFFNRRSALLQTLSTVNFINWSDNNVAKAALAFANQPQYWKDFATIFNSDKLKQRRSGLKSDVNEAEIASAVKGARNKATAALSYLLKIGFTPTQIVDSFAIASGGATFYRNRINTYLKKVDSDGEKVYTQKEAEEKAWEDFSEISEETQQSGDPALISMQQASSIGRLILAFQNTPIQLNRSIKKAALDIKNRRRAPGLSMAQSDLANVSKIIYYGAIQNIIFTSLQNALFALIPGFDDDEDLTEEEQQEKYGKVITTKQERIVNNISDTILKGGFGWLGAVVSTIKNVGLEYLKQEEKTDFLKDHTYTVIQAINISPPIGSKVRKLYSSIQTADFEEDVIEARGWDVTIDGKFNLSPSYRVLGSFTEAATNLPLERVTNEIESITEAFDDRNTAMQRIALALGWKTWDVSARNEEHDLIKTQAKAKRKEEGIKKAKATRKKISDNKKKYKKEYKNLNFYKQYLDLDIEKERKDRARKQVDKSQKIIDSIVQEMKMMEYVLENNKFVKIK